MGAYTQIQQQNTSLSTAMSMVHKSIQFINDKVLVCNVLTSAILAQSFLEMR